MSKYSDMKNSTAMLDYHPDALKDFVAGNYAKLRSLTDPVFAQAFGAELQALAKVAPGTAFASLAKRGLELFDAAGILPAGFKPDAGPSAPRASANNAPLLTL